MMRYVSDIMRLNRLTCSTQKGNDETLCGA